MNQSLFIALACLWHRSSTTCKDGHFRLYIFVRACTPSQTTGGTPVTTGKAILEHQSLVPPVLHRFTLMKFVPKIIHSCSRKMLKMFLYVMTLLLRSCLFTPSFFLRIDYIFRLCVSQTLYCKQCCRTNLAQLKQTRLQRLKPTVLLGLKKLKVS